jgi:putative nucleotidyltransferase with HDIG domain
MTSKELVLKTCDIPAVPLVAVKILKLIDDPNTTIEDLHKAIMADQALATRVLKTANSAFYGVRQNIDTISDAVAMMGFNTIKTLTLAVSTRDVYKKFGLLEQKLWEHSLGVSIAAGIIARDNSHLKNEEAVMAGLLHDIGKVVMNNSQPERFSVLTQKVYEERVLFTSVEKEMFGFTHAEAGSLLAEKWGFPPILCEVIEKHHVCISANETLGDDPYLKLMCSTVALADAVCIRLGVGYRGPMADLDLGIKELRTTLNINEERYDEIIDIFKRMYIEEKMLYQM